MSTKQLNKQFGFSILELAVVLALVTLLISVTLASTSFLDSLLVRSELNKLHAICYATQNNAMVTNIAKTLTFDVVQQTYNCDGMHIALPKQVCCAAPKHIKGPPSVPNTLITKPTTFTNNQITFAPTGVISSGTVYLCNRNKTRWYALSCGVNKVSFLRRYQYQDGKWLLLI